MDVYEWRKQQIEAAIEKYQSPYRQDVFKIICQAIGTGKIDDLIKPDQDVKDATVEQDTKKATDFVWSLSGLTVGFRAREHWNFAPYGHEFTLRCNPTMTFNGKLDENGSAHGAVEYLAEFEKWISDIYPNLFIYAFLHKDRSIRHWMVLRPSVLIEDMQKKINSRFTLPSYIGAPTPNPDDGTYFRAVNMRFGSLNHSGRFPREAIITDSGYLESRLQTQAQRMRDDFARQANLFDTSILR